MNTDEDIEKIARILDPDAWSLHDDPRLEGRVPSIKKTLVELSLEKAKELYESGALAKVDWDRSEYIEARKRIIAYTSRKGYCYSVEDGLDGYVMHDPRCSHWPDSAISGSAICIKER